MSALCIIFDLDGTLVDSEKLCNQAFIDLLPEISDSVEVLTQRYRGLKLSLILADIENRIGHSLPSQFETTYRQRVSDLFQSDLKPMPGVIEMLNKLSFATCIASSGPLKKIHQALQVSGLSAYFGDHIFSSYEIGLWKPDPGLFQHAAHVMGYIPEQCVVIEDSNVGVQAALSAGMTTLQYRPDNDSQSYSGVISFSSMSELPELIDKLIKTARSEN